MGRAVGPTIQHILVTMTGLASSRRKRMGVRGVQRIQVIPQHVVPVTADAEARPKAKRRPVLLGTVSTSAHSTQFKLLFAA